MSTHLITTVPQTDLPDQSDHQPAKPFDLSSHTEDFLWHTADELACHATRFAHASLACQVMAGLVLLELKRRHGRSSGRPKRDSTEADWEALLQMHIGISVATAWRWMKMAEHLKPRLRRLCSADHLRELLSSPSNWTQSDAELIESAVRNATDGRTQAEFLAELGLLKKSTPPPRREHDPSTPPDPSAPPGPSDQSSTLASIALRDWGHIERLLAAYDSAALFTHLPTGAVEAQCAALENALKKRRSFLAGQ